jgi:hypothetical protein
MSNDTPTPEVTPQSEENGRSGPTLGQRLDDLIAKGKQFGVVATNRAKEIADASAPKLKEMGHVASVKAKVFGEKANPTMRHAAAVVAEKSKQLGGASSQAWARCPSRTRKGIYAACAGVAVLLLLYHFVGTRYNHTGSKPAVPKIDQIRLGMDEGQVMGILGEYSSRFDAGGVTSTSGGVVTHEEVYYGYTWDDGGRKLDVTFSSDTGRAISKKYR